MMMKTHDHIVHPSSYKDPSGFVFLMNNLYYRQINQSYSNDYALLTGSGLYQALVKKKMLIAHEEINENLTHSADCHKILLPKQIERVSYATEWCPSQLKDAALLTLKIMDTAIDHGMILKDATPFNIQFQEGAALFIDTLSFEKYDTSKPWVAYRQFCECFLFPLYLHRYLKTGTTKIFAAYPDGIPAAVTRKILPLKSIFNAGAWMHLFMLSSIRSEGNKKQLSFSEKKLRTLIRHLKDIISALNATDYSNSDWNEYYEKTIISRNYLDNKEKIFSALIKDIDFTSALDLGANNGRFSLILSEKKATVIAVDSDWRSINELYLHTRKQSVSNILPLCIDISNPTPATGIMNAERSSFTDRMRADLVVALALIHHMVFVKNVPLNNLAFYLAAMTRQYLIVEFIPVTDEKVRELIKNKDRSHHYNESFFEECFSSLFLIESKQIISGSERVLYRMKKKGA